MFIQESIIKTVIGLALLLIAAGSAFTQKPNVLILFSDQHNKNVMGFEGHPDVITPNLDQLAKEGIRYTHAFTAAGVCAPCRSTVIAVPGIGARLCWWRPPPTGAANSPSP